MVNGTAMNALARASERGRAAGLQGNHRCGCAPAYFPAWRSAAWAVAQFTESL